MLGVGNVVIVIPFKIIGQEAHSVFQCHGPGSKRERHQLRRCQAAAGRDKALGIGPEEVQTHFDPAEVLLVLRGGGGAETNGIAEVIGDQPGHHGVQVNDAERETGLGIQHDVVELGIVVRDADGKLAPIPHPLQRSGFLLAGEKKVYLRADFCQTAGGVRLDGEMKLPVAVGGVVKIRNRLTERLRRKVSQLILETAEGNRALVEVHGRFRRLEAEAVLDKIVYPPVFSGFILTPGLPVLCRHQMQRSAGIGVSGGEKFRDGGYVSHETGNIRKGGPAEPLEDIAFSGVGDDKEGEVDMPFAVSLAGDGAAVQTEAIQNLFHSQHSSEEIKILQMFFQQDQIYIGNAVENRGDDGNLPISEFLIHGPGALVAGIGVDAQLRPLMLQGILLIEPDKLWAEPSAEAFRRDHQRMQDADLIRRNVILPGGTLIDIHLNLVDQGGAIDLVVLLHHKEVTPLQGGFRRGPDGVYARKPSGGDEAAPFGFVGIVIELDDTGKIKNHCSSDIHAGHSHLALFFRVRQQGACGSEGGSEGQKVTSPSCLSREAEPTPSSASSS